jgi:hypothetical protein
MPRRRTERGAGLLAATLLAMLLSTAAAVLISTVRSSHATALEDAKIEDARLTAQAIAEAAVVKMDSGATDLRLDGSFSKLPYGERGTLRLQDTAGLVDVNAAAPADLAALFRGLGFNDEAAATLADRIADWRGSGDLKRLHGANDADYAAAGLPAPAHRPFETEREIVKVMGVTPVLAACLEPYLTVFSGAEEIDPAAAPAYLKPIAAIGSVAGGGAALGVPVGHVIIVTADAPISKSAVLRLREWVRLTGDRRNPFMTHRALTEFAPASEPSPQRCGEAGAIGGRT